MKNKERLLEILLLVVGIIILINSLVDLKFITRSGRIGAGFFPILMSLTVILSMFFLIISSVIKEKKSGHVDKKNITFEKKVLKKQFKYLIAIIMTIILSKIFGFILALNVFLFLALVFMENIKWPKAVFFSLTIGLSMYLVIIVWLNVPLPSGMFF